jgi:hypothetical protein
LPDNRTKEQEQTAGLLSEVWRRLRDRYPPKDIVLVWNRPCASTPCGLSALEEARTLVAEIRAASRRQRSIYFPTTGYAGVWAARLTELEPTGDSATPPLVQLAPWSLFTLDASNFETVQKAIKLAPPSTDSGRGKSFLLELFLAKADFEIEVGDSPMTFLVTGDSLGLPICLAAWAVNQGRSLRRICATGNVKEDGTIAGVEIGDKLSALNQLFDSRQKRVLFLMPEDNSPQLYVRKDLSNIVINGRRRHCEIPVDHLDNLFSRPNILTDCFDDYRTAVREWRPQEIQDLDSARSLFDDCNNTHLVVVPEFDRDPIAVAGIIAHALVDRITEQDERKDAPHGFAAECPTPLLLPLEQCGEESKDFADGLVEALEAGIADWVQHLSFKVDNYFHELLQEVVRFECEKLWLIVYCGKSLVMKSYEDLQKRIDRLRTHSTPGRIDHLVFIASDYHHYLMLRKQLRLNAASASTAETLT